LGRDALTGGLDADLFVYQKIEESAVGALRDKITDFDAGSAATSIDRIDLRAIDAITTVIGNQAFTFIGTAPFTGTAGQLRVRQAGSTAIVAGDVDGDAYADFEIALLNFTNLANLTSRDFLK
jgi:Ca2+-binding RTX toxin-like protein